MIQITCLKSKCHLQLGFFIKFGQIEIRCLYFYRDVDLRNAKASPVNAPCEEICGKYDEANPVKYVLREMEISK